jgi:hypothetical protein
MAHVQFTDVQDRPMEFLDLTSLTLDEFHQLVPPFEAAFHAHMVAWRLDGKPRTARRFSVYQTCPLPTPEDRLLFILTYVQTYSLQVVHGRLFGMGQSKANQWIHVLLPVLLAALRTLGDVPARSLSALAQRLGVSEADATTVATPRAEEATPVATTPATARASPLLCELARKKGNPSLDGAMHRLLPFALPPVPRMRMPHQRSQAARLNDLLFEVVTRVAPHVAYAFVSKSRAALHTFARAGRGAGTREETQSQVTRCPYLSEQALIVAERFSHPLLLSLPYTFGS